MSCATVRGTLDDGPGGKEAGMNTNTKILTAGFAVILAGMAGLVVLFLFHVNTITTEDRINAELVDKNLAADKMREAAERRSFVSC